MENLSNNQELFLSLISSFILQTFLFDSGLTWLGEIRCQSLLEVKGLKQFFSFVLGLVLFSIRQVLDIITAMVVEVTLMTPVIAIMENLKLFLPIAFQEVEAWPLRNKTSMYELHLFMF